MSRVWDENWFGSTKTLDVHIRWLRQKLGDDAADAALHPHGARRRVPLHGARRVAAVSLRARLLARALLRPAAGDPRAAGAARRQRARPRRRRGQARRRCTQAEIVAATASGARARRLPGARRRTRPPPRCAAASSWSTRGARCSPTAPGRRPRGDDYATRPEIAAALRGRAGPGASGPRDDARPADPRHRGADARGGRTAPAPCGSRRASTPSTPRVNRATLGLALIGGVVLLLGLGAGALIAGQVARPLRRLDEAAAPRRRRRPGGAGAGRGVAPSSGASRARSTT